MRDPMMRGKPETKRYFFFRDGEIGEDSIARCYSCGYVGKVKKNNGEFKGLSMEGLDDALDFAFGKIHYKKIPAHFECSKCGCHLLELIEDKRSKKEDIMSTIGCFLVLGGFILVVIAIIIRIFQ